MRTIRRWNCLPYFVIVAAVIFSFDSAKGQDTSNDPRPNVVLIMVDDMGYSDIGCYGGEIQTPNLDKLAAGGLRFTQFYNTARCCPTRASLMSGLYPHQAGMGWMTGRKTKHEGYRGEINRQCVTIAEVLRMAGYSTYMSGKWHLSFDERNPTPRDSWPIQRGFDQYFGTITGAGSFYTPDTLTRNNKRIEAPKKGFYYTDAITDHATEFIRGHHKTKKQRPFFLYTAYTAPHWPLHALKEDIAKYQGKYMKGWDALRKERHARMKKMGIVDPKWKLSPRHPNAIPWSEVPDEKKKEMDLKMAIYAAQIDRVDQGIGRIVTALRKTGQFENTLILFLADNGGCAENGRFGFERMAGGVLGENSSFASYGLCWANASNTPFRLFKHWVHEGGVSTPLIVHWPARIPPAQHGRFRQQPGHLIDIMATCVDVAKAKYPTKFKGKEIRPMEGKSLLPAFADKEIKREAIYWEHEGNRAVRVGDWKLVAAGAKGKWELYNLNEDRTETNNLIEKHPDRAANLAAMWERYAKRAQVYPLVPYYNRKKANKKTSFELKRGTKLLDGDAPQVAKRSLSIEATIGPKIGDGVIVAQGGNNHGYSLFVKDGKLGYSMRRKGKLITVVAKDVLPRQKMEIACQLSKKGNITFQIDGKIICERRAPGALVAQPVLGLLVGADLGDPVGDYQGPNAFRGELHGVRLRLGKR